jgi:hypothetical protein
MGFKIKVHQPITLFKSTQNNKTYVGKPLNLKRQYGNGLIFG